MEPREPLLELSHVSVSYGKFSALIDVSYQIFEGSVVCLLGGNASGKSTSMKTICGTTTVTAGEIRWQGELITHEATPRRMRRGIGVVPEGRRVFASLTVRENLYMGAWTSQSHTRDAETFDEMMVLFPPLQKLLDRPSGVLSGGEQQMVAFARALMKRPSLILMDEPSMGLSPALVKRCFSAIETIRDRGVSVFIVEQNAQAALAIADYAYVLSSGRLAVEGVPEFVSGTSLMREAYLGKGKKEDE